VIIRSEGDVSRARLDGKVALITGAGTSIGRATARAIAASGTKVFVAEINTAADEQTAQIISQAIPTDMSQEGSVKAAIETAVRHNGVLQILRSNAGSSAPAESTVVDAPIQES
jgi:NAD(P)-dependent dehydrogenase (short-subunit alcohol dehydrogenase family)